MKPVNLTHHFLIAMPNMQDPCFARTLTYICEHDEDGAMGIIINRPTDLTLQALYEQVDIPLLDTGIHDHAVFFGGPVHMERGFVLHQPAGEWTTSVSRNDDIGLTTSKDILTAVGQGQGPDRFLVALGYAGWEAGQLEAELAQNAWLSVPANFDILFDRLPAERLSAAMHLLGFDMLHLSDEAGHA